MDVYEKTYFPSVLEFDVTVSVPGGGSVTKKGRFSSKVDMTSVPQGVIQSLKPTPKFESDKKVFYYVNISLGGVNYELTQVLSLPKGEDVIIGRDILGRLFKRANNSLAILGKMGKDLISASILDDMREALSSIAKSVVDIFEAEKCDIFLVDEDDFKKLKLKGTNGDIKPFGLPSEYMLGKGLTGLAAKGTLRIRDIDDYADELRKKEEGIEDWPEIWSIKGKRTEVKTFLAVPLIVEDQTIGVMRVINKKTYEGFTPEDEFLLEVLAIPIAIVIRGAQLIREERLSAWQRVSAEAAHEMGNKMDGLGEWLVLLKKSLSKANLLSDPFLRYITKMSNVIEDTKEILREFKSLSTPLQLKIKEIDLNDLLYKEFEELLYGDGVKVKLGLEKELPLIEADPVRLKQVFLNLIKNAREAMEDKGEITITTEFLREEDYVKIEVMDTGPGILPENRARIFDPFFGTKEKGTGLGLAITKHIIEAHRGSIEEVSHFSEEGGAKFKILLPIRQTKEK